MLDYGFYNMDCMDGMREFPDKYFDLAIVDPPYGGATEASEIKCYRTGGQWASKFGRHIEKWDNAPQKEYFDELFRVSKNQIIWGGNYFKLPPTRCFIVWRKTNVPLDFTMAMAEYAWTSFNANAKVFDFSAVGQQNRFHPTQKPVDLYLFCLKNFAKQGDKILDTHAGSASSLVACEKAGFRYVGFEIDKEYYEKAKRRLDTEKSQFSIFQFMG